MRIRTTGILTCLMLALSWPLWAQHEGGQHTAAAHEAEAATEEHAQEGEAHHATCSCEPKEEGEFDVAAVAFHHIGDANAFHIWGDIYFPLPVMLYDRQGGKWDVMMSSRFDYKHNHGNGRKAINRYVLVEGVVYRVADEHFPAEEVQVDCVSETEHEGEKHPAIVYKGQCYELEAKTTWDGGFTGGGPTSFYDFSITKNVFTMLLVFFLLGWMFVSVRKAYQKRQGMAPTGLQNLVELMIMFIQEEVAKPFIGKHYFRYMPFLISLFFFILALNLIGQIPFFPGSGNVTGNISATAGLALVTAFRVYTSANKHYWEHVFWMPGVPAWVKVILTPVEMLGLLIKPFTLMLRLFANITAGHVVLISFVGLIFIFGKMGESIAGATAGIFSAFVLNGFMMAIEVLVALIQAFVFTLLAASYLGDATQEAH
ncbi:MAG TPA: ATP synthase F0 subunit A [Phaeodactylibacter sp.]|nr:ATP synthase F0 subunit A [Phaeodactylibacter sp.]